MGSFDLQRSDPHRSHEPGAGGRGAAFQGRARLTPATERAALEGRAPDRRFMGSLLDSQFAHRDHEPGRDALRRVPADQQVGPTRFMESEHLKKFDVS